MTSYGREPVQQQKKQSPYYEQYQNHYQGPYQPSFQGPYPTSSFYQLPKPPPEPYYMPPYYPVPTFSRGPPMHIVDQRLPEVRFRYRPRSYKIALALLVIGVIFCFAWVVLTFSNLRYGIDFLAIISILFLAIGLLGIISIILLLIPKKIGWYFAFITSCLALSGLGPGTLIGMYLMICLLWPSIRYYFHTGMYPPQMPLNSNANFQKAPHLHANMETRFRD